MANRNMQQKKAKMQRMRRAWARSYSVRSSGTSQHLWVRDDNGKPVDMGFSKRNELAATNTDFSTMDRALLRTFKSTDTEAIYARTQGLHTDLLFDNPIVLARMVHSTSNAGSLQKERRYVYKNMHMGQNANPKTRWYISGESSFFVRETRTDTELVYRISYEYSTLFKAQLAYTKKNILWNPDLTQRVPIP
jgi:hypothetical protein